MSTKNKNTKKIFNKEAETHPARKIPHQVKANHATMRARRIHPSPFLGSQATNEGPRSKGKDKQEYVWDQDIKCQKRDRPSVAQVLNEIWAIWRKAWNQERPLWRLTIELSLQHQSEESGEQRKLAHQQEMLPRNVNLRTGKEKSRGDQWWRQEPEDPPLSP